MSAKAKELSTLRKEELVQKLLEAQRENATLKREMELLRQQRPSSSQTDVAKYTRSSSGPLRNALGSPITRHTDPNAIEAPHQRQHQQHHQQQQLQKSRGEPYTISLSVMLIENGTAISVPLAAIIDKSFTRADMRETDTPVVGSSCMRDDESCAWYSVGGSGRDERSPSTSHADDCIAGRSTELLMPRPNASGSGGSGGGGGGGRPSISLDFGNDDALEPSPQDPAAQQQQQQTRRRSIRHELRRLSLGAMLNRRSLSLDPDALVSHQTLRTFHRQFLDGCNALSPISSYGNAIYHYIVRTFAVRNGCRHNPSDLEGFGRTLTSLCGEVKTLLQSGPRHGSIVSPCYVFGDLHGNFWDLFYFLDNLISFQDLRYTPHRFLFLGDYVDRGDFSVEVVAYLFAMKVLAPDKVLLLRGNHEDTLVSGDITGYGNTSFRSQCRSLFGSVLGEELWHKASETFAYLPLTANIDGRIFCTHGGIPRYRGGVDDRLEILCREDFPPLESFFRVPEDETPHQRMCRQIGMDTCWADPADDESALDKWGFGANPRGSGVILFGSKAVDDFLDRYGYEYIFRAHQEKSDGLKLSKSARVFTIFSTSAYVGHENGAGVVLVADKKIRLIIKNADSSNDCGDNAQDADLELGEENR